MGVVEIHLGTPLHEEFVDLQGRALPNIVDVFLIGHAQDQNLAPVDDLPLALQGRVSPGDDEVGLVGVHLSGQLDEVGAEIVLLGLPGEVEGVDGNAVSAQSGAGVEGLEAERLCLGRLDHFDDVDVHPQTEHLQFVHQGDVHGPVGVLQNLRHLRRPGVADGDGLDDSLVETLDHLKAIRSHPAHDLGDLPGGELLVARILPLGGVTDEVLPSQREPPFFEKGEHLLLGGSREGGALQNDNLPRPEGGGDALGRVEDHGEVGLHVVPQGCGDADQEGVRLDHSGKIGGGREGSLLLNEALEEPVLQVLDRALSGVDHIHAPLVHVESENPVPGLEKLPGQG